MTKRHRYEEEFKQRALQKLSTRGNVRKLARVLGISVGTLVNWKRQPQPSVEPRSATNRTEF